MAGRPQPKPNALGIWPQQDAGGIFARRCVEFADEYGYARAYVGTHWAQFAIQLELECGYERALAEDTSWNHIRAALRECKFGEPD